MKGGRKLSEWNKFVSKVYHEGKKSDPHYEFKNALKDASKRKSEMGHSASASGLKKSRKGNKKHMMSKTRRNKTHKSTHK
jgi:hypothetical protein